MYNLTGVLLVVLPAASTSLKIKSILPWMRSASLEIERSENPSRGYGLGGSILIQEIQHDGFAFSGIFFRITYKFLGNVFSLMITYAMIILQLR
ncbi:unnamed protein product [Allacma fusca]|uniref:Uncharacterized protein n=1 Tax=Allacma fusca TaxID=39272 RepID=A0A8J2K906_9HEXA|nr:unnamed protein product [Allacma fusca]